MKVNLVCVGTELTEKQASVDIMAQFCGGKVEAALSSDAASPAPLTV